VDLNPDGDGALDWATSGTSFAIIKATQGTGYTDGDFATNWAALKAAHVVRGAYHFFDATVSGVDQANYFLQVVGTIEAGDLPPTLDIECPVPGESDCLGNGNSGEASSAQITQAMNDFLTTVKSATGLTPIVYSYGSWFSDNGVDTTGLDAYPLWLADYSGTTCFNVPSPWTVATFWQYDDSGSVSGINVDDDYFLGSMAQLSAFTSKGSLPIDGGTSSSEAGSAYGMCTESTTGAMGVCIDTSSCTSEGGKATPDFCPGPANIQCCTGLPMPKDAGTSNDKDATVMGSGSHSSGTGAGGGTTRGSGTGSGTERASVGGGSGTASENEPGGDEVAPGSSGGCGVARRDGGAPTLAMPSGMAWIAVGVSRRRRRR
jgi:GH25 family lysozyme M1 (1,4-beta-N-acetylmuramidase)